MPLSILQIIILKFNFKHAASGRKDILFRSRVLDMFYELRKLLALANVFENKWVGKRLENIKNGK